MKRSDDLGMGHRVIGKAKAYRWMDADQNRTSSAKSKLVEQRIKTPKAKS
jgi:hypothetical protein